jgi:hypothetical protein
MGPERVWVQVVDVDVAADREITFGKSLAEGLGERQDDIRGAIEAGIQSYLVLSGSTRLESIPDYVYQPTRVLQSVADLVEEIKTGQASDRLDSPALSRIDGHERSFGQRHQTDVLKFQKPRPAMTK